MLSPEHCLVRAERLRIAMLTAPNSIAETRLRGFVHKYKDLAGRAKLTLIPATDGNHEVHVLGPLRDSFSRPRPTTLS